MGELRIFLKEQLPKWKDPVIFISSDFIPGCPKCNSSATVYYIKLTERNSIPNKQFYGFISALMTLMQIVLMNIIPKIERRYSNKKLFIQIYTLIPAIGFILMGFVSYIPLNIILILIVIGFGFSRKILFVKGINFQIESENRATVLSTINMAGSLLRTVLYPLIGYLVMWNLDYTFIILGATIMALVAISRIKNEDI